VLGLPIVADGLKDGGRILSTQSVGEVTISKGYITYAINSIYKL
jgi:hypothetical protein